MSIIDINWNPSRKDLRVFAVLQLVFFAIVATIVFRRVGSFVLPGGVLAVSLVVAAAGSWRPAWIRPVYITWMAAVMPIGVVVSYVVLAIVWYLVITPVGLTMRLCGRDPMRRRFDPQATTYWIPRPESSPIHRYFRPY